MADPFYYPHPLVTSSVLYVRDAPPRVKWNNLVATFKICGPVAQLGAIKTKGNHRTWTVRFSDIAHAELALATLRGTSVKDLPATSPWPLALFHSAHPSDTDQPSASWALPQYVIGVKLQALAETNIFALFSIFRRAGPLVSLRLDVDLGRESLVCAVRYWAREHADAASSGVAAALRERFRQQWAISLKVYDPCTLLVTNLERSLELGDVQAHFGKFGTIVEKRMERLPGGGTASCTLTFANEEAAKIARASMDQQFMRSLRIHVTYIEYGSRAKGTPNPPSPGREEPQSSAKADTPKEQACKQKERAAAMSRVQDAEAAEAAAIKQAFAARNAHARAAKALDDASDINRLRGDALTAAEAQFHEAQGVLEEAEKAFLVAQTLVELKGSVYHAAKERMESARTDFNEAFQEEAFAKVRSDRAMQDEEIMRRNVQTAREIAAELFRSDNTADMVWDDLQESIRRMQELHEQEGREGQPRGTQKTHEDEIEESRRRMEEFYAEERQHEDEKRKAEAERQTKDAQAKAAGERRKREEAERRAEEQRKKEETAHREAERLKKLYDDAVDRERERCRRRDDAISPSGFGWWTIQHSLERFKLVSDEFDRVQFGETQPLTMWNIPWPTLDAPFDIDLESISWDMVDGFFEEIGFMMSTNDYRALVEKTHRRFHPDKWRSRRLLLSVRNEDLRKKLEAAGNIVAQAMTPLWRKSKNYSDSDDD